MFENFRFGHRSNELLQVERFEVGHILIVLQGYGFFCQGEHHLGQWAYVVDEVCVGVCDFLAAFGRTVSEEIDGMFLQIL